MVVLFLPKDESEIDETSDVSKIDIKKGKIKCLICYTEKYLVLNTSSDLTLNHL